MAKARELSEPGDGQQRRIESQISLSDAKDGNALEWNPYAKEETWALLHRDPPAPEVDDVAKDLWLQAYKDTLIITIKGIAAGMQNTG